MNNGKFGPMKADIAALLSILILVAARFWRTIFMGAPISRADMIAHWDSLFQGMKASSAVGIEEGAVLFMPPYRFLVAHLWRAGEIPLWNQYSCLGCPLIGDPQSIVFSPLLWPLIIEPSQYVYNLTLVLELAIMAAGMYLLARQLSLGITTSLFAALTICFCPYLQWYLELLGSGYCLIPLLFFTFAKLAKEVSLRSAAIAGAAASLMVLSAHPETSICAVSTACIFMLLLVMVGPVSPEQNRRKKLLKAGMLLCLAGGLAVCLAAPVLIQTAEFILNSDSYKYGRGNPALIPWQAILANLVMPVNGAISPYLGIVAFLALPLGLFSKHRKLTLVLMLYSVVIMGMTAKFSPFEYLYLFKPLDLIVATYFTPVMLILSALVAALGFERLVSSKGQLSISEWLWLAAAAGIAIGFRPLLIQSGISFDLFNFDMAFPSPGPSRSHWTLQIIFIAAIIILLAAHKKLSSRHKPTTVAVAVIGLMGIMSQLLISFQALPTRQSFDYPEISPLKEIKEDGGRMVALGPHLYKPNTNLVQGIRDFRFLNAIFPERFLDFAEKSGATITSFKVDYNLPLSPLLNLAGVKNILSLQPIYNTRDLEKLPLLKAPQKTPIDFPGGLSLLGMESTYVQADRSVFGKLSFRPPDGKSDLAYQLMVNSSRDGSAIYWSDLKPLKNKNDNSRDPIVETFSIPLPSKLPKDTEVLCTLRVQDTKSGRSVMPLKAKKGSSEAEPIELLEFVYEGITKNSQGESSYRLKEENDHGIRWYQSDRARPDAYLAHRAIAADSLDEALELISNPKFDAASNVVLEKNEPGVATFINDSSKRADGDSTRKDRVEYKRESNNSILVTTDSEKQAVLIITESYYPGWKATVDGRSVPIVHANYLFKSVILEAGHHEVRFTYFPDSFKAGLLLLLVGIIGTAIAALKRSDCKINSQNQ